LHATLKVGKDEDDGAHGIDSLKSRHIYYGLESGDGYVSYRLY
jgi:hypothetical protein